MVLSRYWSISAQNNLRSVRSPLGLGMDTQFRSQAWREQPCVLEFLPCSHRPAADTRFWGLNKLASRGVLGLCPLMLPALRTRVKALHKHPDNETPCNVNYISRLHWETELEWRLGFPKKRKELLSVPIPRLATYSNINSKKQTQLLMI